MATELLPRPTATRWPRLVAGLVTGLVAELLVLGALAFAAWGNPESEHRPPLSFADGTEDLVIFGGVASLFVLGAAAAIATTRQWWGMALSTVLLGAAGIVGFFGFVLISMSRQETSDC